MTKERILYIVLIVVLFSTTIFYYNKSKKPILIESQRIDTIYVDNVIIQHRIDSIKSELIIVQDKYEKAFDYIIDNSVMEDIDFFANYLDSQSNKRLFGGYNSLPIKTN